MLKKSIAVLSVFAAGCAAGGGGKSADTEGLRVPPEATSAPTSASDATILTSAPEGSYSDSDRLATYNFLNAQRTKCGFGARAQNAALDKAAQAHADFIAANLDAGRSDAYGHAENPSYPGYTGTLPLDRANSHSYGGIGVGENLAAESTALKAAEVLMSVTYHTLGTLGFDREIGIGKSERTVSFAVPITVLKVGIRSAADVQYLDSREVATFPCDGQAGVTTTHGDESPNPLPGRSLTTNPAGRAIVAVVRAHQTLTDSEFSIAPAGGTQLKATLLTNATDPNKMLPASVAVIMPDESLVAKTTYTAQLVGTNNGQPVNKTWRFTTQ
ncbi:CAP domain-containing protein [Cupriavidus sp. CuC1]|uniref:CAP domain-containing protein n=1 Tax=Cupriavidus sp. CuC1 TaxID=3373131 RepID=UPI0037D40A14